MTESIPAESPSKDEFEACNSKFCEYNNTTPAEWELYFGFVKPKMVPNFVMTEDAMTEDAMTLEEFGRLKYFATACGVKIISCKPEYGGEYGYTTEDRPDVSRVGYTSERDAYTAWLQNAFGERAGIEVRNLVEAGPVCYFS